MVKNMGTVDRVVRAVAAVIILVLWFTNVISGALAIILGFLAMVLLATSIIGFCPLYVLFKISTLK